MDDAESNELISKIIRIQEQAQQQQASSSSASLPPILRKRRRRDEMPILEPAVYLVDGRGGSSSAMSSPRKISRLRALRNPEESTALDEGSTTATVQDFQQAYIAQLAERQGGNNMLARKVERRLMTDASVEARLRMVDVDLNTLSCCVPLCGRSFDSLHVLAWHASYAHQDSSVTLPGNALCLVCGIELDNAKGKLAHLTTRHRSLMAEHSRQCMQMRGAFLAPQSPAAIRLRKKAEQTIVMTKPSHDLPVDFDVDGYLFDDLTGDFTL